MFAIDSFVDMSDWDFDDIMIKALLCSERRFSHERSSRIELLQNRCFQECASSTLKSLSSTKTLLFELISSHAKFLATTLDDDASRIRRKRLIAVILVAYCLLLIAYWDFCYAIFDWRWSNRSIVVRFSESTFAESAISFWNNTEFLTRFLLILSNLNFLSSSWFCDNSRCFDHRRSSCWSRLIILEALNREWDDRSQCSLVVSRRLEYRNSFLIEIFSNLRLLFQSSWCSWLVVTAMSNQELEMIDACRWKSNNWNSCVDFFLHRDSLFLKLFKFELAL